MWVRSDSCNHFALLFFQRGDSYCSQPNHLNRLPRSEGGAPCLSDKVVLEPSLPIVKALGYELWGRGPSCQERPLKLGRELLDTVQWANSLSCSRLKGSWGLVIMFKFWFFSCLTCVGPACRFQPGLATNVAGLDASVVLGYEEEYKLLRDVDWLIPF